MSQMTGELTVRKSIVVGCAVETAFRVFTEKTAEWWPHDDHTIFGGDTREIRFEGRVGGRVYEVSAGGEEGDWGTITAWDPPRSFAMTWHPGRPSGEAPDLEVRFTPEGSGTRLDLVHANFERRGADARAVRDRYDGGWDIVLGGYARRAAAGAAPGTGERSGT